MKASETRCPECGSTLPAWEGLCPACVARSMASLLGSGPESGAFPSLAGYVFEERIGRGGMGEVFRARRVADGLVVAIKLASTRRPELTERLAREAVALARLEHPHILRVLDSGLTADQRFFLVTEYAAGGDLARRLADGPLPVPEAVSLFRAAVQAVGAAHRAGILHRDIKPANVLLDAAGRLQLADFSLARLAGADGATAHSLTGGADVFGTAYYLAPEARRSAARADARTDIFSLGVLLHEMLTGRVPIGHYVPASQVAAVPTAVDALVARCLAEDSARRPATAEALAAEFEQALRAPATRARLVGLACGIAMVLAGALLALRPWNEPAGSSEGRTPPGAATRSRPFINSLGLRFVPAPDPDLLFSIWETRRSDFAVFASHGPERVARAEAPWRQAPGQPGSDHPVTFVDLPAAQQFCAWLTARERADGLLSSNEFYRLPTDEEWGRAAGLRAERGATPQAREEAAARERGHYAWGRTWPPPGGGIPANFAADEAHDVGRRSLLRSRDAWPYTAPVGSFPANDFGLFDLSGNAAEWCDTPWNDTTDERVLRGGSWNQSSPMALRLTTRQHVLPVTVLPGAGFRIVLDRRGR